MPRGNWMDKSGKVVQPHTPHFLKQLDTGGRRAESARPGASGSSSRDNPLTARVVVNRLWKQYYGIGLSKVLIDMGSRRRSAAEPGALDWLAVEFMDSGWDVKHMIRLMVTTSAYRQSSLPRPELEAIDPDNRLVARQSRFRLEAEQIRDNALAVSGLLVNKWAATSCGRTSRRSITRRSISRSAITRPRRATTNSAGRCTCIGSGSILHPWLLAFDAPSREECTADRPISNTPTAALVLLNDPSFVEAARALAAQHSGQGDRPTTTSEFTGPGGRCWAAMPRRTKPTCSRKLLEKHRSRVCGRRQGGRGDSVGRHLAAARRMSTSAELAAWTSVSRVLLNLNETITRN